MSDFKMKFTTITKYRHILSVFDRMISLFRVQLFMWVFLLFRIQMSTCVCNQWVVTLTKQGHS